MDILQTIGNTFLLCDTEGRRVVSRVIFKVTATLGAFLLYPIGIMEEIAEIIEPDEDTDDQVITSDYSISISSRTGEIF
ncbi:MAG: hypothetical protein HGB03_01285 [Candidatus Yonathbacteria bacterium]|nr:hypothetical protein [Candidatus Yonathbacteria bacterium]NTW47897.1 hypothetical protein [Candidatus Yonathbacteria bacterium]